MQTYLLPSRPAITAGKGRHHRSILIVDDSINDAALTVQALAREALDAEIVVVSDGVEAMDYLFGRGNFRMRSPGNPVLMLLDVKMPRMDGLEVLRQVKKHPQLRRIPIVMFTSSCEESDVADSYEHGANAYVVKPVDFDQFTSAIHGIRNFWATLNLPPVAVHCPIAVAPATTESVEHSSAA